MTNLNIQVSTLDLPYENNDDTSVEQVKTFAKWFGDTIPGLYYDESLTTVNSYNYCCAYICMEETNIPVIVVKNYSYTSAGRAARGLGYCFINASGKHASSYGTTSVNDAYGQYWYRNGYTAINQFRICYTAAIPGITLFNINANSATDVNPAFTMPLDHFITTLTPANSNVVSNKAVFRYYGSTIGWSGNATKNIFTNTSTAVPSNLRLPNKFFYLDKAYLYNNLTIINGIMLFSGLQEDNSSYVIFEADGNTHITLGIRSGNNWMPCIVLP